MKGKLRRLPPLIKRSVGGVLKAQPKVADIERGSEHKEWRAIVCGRAGWRCEWVSDGSRCPKSAPNYRLVADHIVERTDGGRLYDPANGQCLCFEHHTIKTNRARVQRMTGG